MGNREIFATRLKEIRMETKKSQKEFANMVQSTAATISAYENAAKNPSLDIVMNIAEKCNVSIDWLCGLSDKQENNYEPKTYGEIIDLLFKIECSMGNLQIDSHNRIIIDDDIIKIFLNDWNKMLSLYRNGSIDSKLYELWMNLKKLDYKIIHLGNKEEIDTYLDIIKTANSTSESHKK